MKSKQNIQNENLKNLIILCTYNLKGITAREQVEVFLPIQEKDLKIFKQDNKIIFQKRDNKIGEVWIEANTYSNLEILRYITQEYNIKCKSDDIIELIKYRNEIIAVLL